jgi:hypothetical protein
VTGTLWIPGFERLTPSKGGGAITSKAGPHVIWHTVEAPAGTEKMFQRMIDFLTEKSAEPHVLIDPLTDRAGQFLPLNLSGRALQNDDGRQTNRTGRVCIQIEVMGYAADPFTNDDTWKPGPNWRALMAAIRSHGVPDIFPMGRPPKYPGGSVRDADIYYDEAGHYCHANVPGNDHGDPGAIAPSKLFALGASKPPTPEGNPLSALTPADAALIGKAVADALTPKLDAIEQKYTIADNNFDSQRAAYEAVAQAEAARILNGSPPSSGELLAKTQSAVWAYLRPLWAKP